MQLSKSKVARYTSILLVLMIHIYTYIVCILYIVIERGADKILFKYYFSHMVLTFSRFSQEAIDMTAQIYYNL